MRGDACVRPVHVFKIHFDSSASSARALQIGFIHRRRPCIQSYNPYSDHFPLSIALGNTFGRPTHDSSYPSSSSIKMPVVPPEKLVKLQQQGDGIRNVSQKMQYSPQYHCFANISQICILAHVVGIPSTEKIKSTAYKITPGPRQDFIKRRLDRHQWSHLCQTGGQDPIPGLPTR